MSKFEQDQYKITVTKSDNTAVKIVTILSLCLFFTTICVLGIVFSDYGPWVTIGLLAISLHPSVRDRISGKYQSSRLEDRLTLLEVKLAQTEQQLMDAQHHLLVLEEGHDFDKRIGVKEPKAGQESKCAVEESLALTVAADKSD